MHASTYGTLLSIVTGINVNLYMLPCMHASTASFHSTFLARALCKESGIFSIHELVCSSCRQSGDLPALGQMFSTNLWACFMTLFIHT